MQATENSFRKDFYELVCAIEDQFRSYHIGTGKHYTALAVVSPTEDIGQMWVRCLGLEESYKHWCSSSIRFIKALGCVVDLAGDSAIRVPILWDIEPSKIPERFREGFFQVAEMVKNSPLSHPFFTTDLSYDMSAVDGFEYLRADLDMNWVSSVPSLMAQMADHDGRRAFHRATNSKGRAINNVRRLYKQISFLLSIRFGRYPYIDALKALREQCPSAFELDRDLSAIDIIIQRIGNSNTQGFDDRVMQASILHYRTLANRFSNVIKMLELYFKNDSDPAVALIEYLPELQFSQELTEMLQTLIFRTQEQATGKKIPGAIKNFDTPLLGKFITEPIAIDKGIAVVTDELKDQSKKLGALLVDAIFELYEERNGNGAIYGSYKDLSTLTQVRLLRSLFITLTSVNDPDAHYQDVALAPANIGVNPNDGEFRIPVKILGLIKPDGIVGLDKSDELFAVIEVPASDVRLFESGLYFRLPEGNHDQFTHLLTNKASVATRYALNMAVPYIQGTKGYTFVLPLSSFDDFHVAAN